MNIEKFLREYQLVAITNPTSIWLLFWPILAIGAYVGYVIAAKKQHKSISVPYTILLAASLLLILVVWIFIG